MPDEESGGTRRHRFRGRPRRRETRLERAERVADPYKLVLILILTTFVVTIPLPPEGWAGCVIAIAGLPAIVAFASSGVETRRF